MLFHLLYPLGQDYTFFNLFRYITFRSALAFALASIITVLWARKFIGFMKTKQFGQVVRDDGPKSHLAKAGTPTMGGVVIIGSISIVLGVCGNFLSAHILVAISVMISFFLLGFLDDYLKVIKKNSDGVSAKGKLLWQFITGLLVGYYIYETQLVDTKVYIPFLKGALIDIGPYYILFTSFVIVGSSNAVNLTDGLDGLAIGSIVTSAACFGLLAYVAGHKELADYLYIPYIESAGELTVMAAAMVGAGVGFLWYNAYPAEIFMGDVGSLSLGGVLGTFAVLTKNEFLFTIIGGIFVFETVSVILQVATYKMFKKRIFKMAPIHHHFELKGWPEPKVIVRFWIVSIFLAILAIATLKIR
jgi:phospho-N-acetylmuramoyl-pentapeptide-transferase